MATIHPSTYDIIIAYVKEQAQGHVSDETKERYEMAMYQIEHDREYKQMFGI